MYNRWRLCDRPVLHILLVCYFLLIYLFFGYSVLSLSLSFSSILFCCCIVLRRIKLNILLYTSTTYSADSWWHASLIHQLQRQNRNWIQHISSRIAVFVSNWFHVLESTDQICLSSITRCNCPLHYDLLVVYCRTQFPYSRPVFEQINTYYTAEYVTEFILSETQKKLLY